MGILEKIKDIEAEMAKTQKNKATEYHLAARPTGKTGAKGEGFDVMRSGDARVAMIGFPSVGKSTLLNKLTKTHSEAGAYEFTTLTCIPGKIDYHGAQIQLLDLPGIIEGASQGKGRGRQVVAVARTSDLILMVLDATKARNQRELLERELEAVGIRVNKSKPNVYFKVKTGGGISITTTCKLTKITERMIDGILRDYRIYHAEVLIREDITVDELVDVILGNRKYIRCLYCYNKVDSISMEELDRIAREPNTCVISCEWDLNLDYLVDQIWEHLNLLTVYTKKRGEYPDFEEGIILRNGATIEHVCHSIHRSLAKHNPQKVGIQHKVAEGDVVQILKKK
ncbi:P-loop containing nucleoside triphosphate hydrolase protein [Catenaria anguillulae PL171]|uniref:p-loop containing nucleoside triphosphate hydrolase protein n=1 Tax=Catenaria anguillulae PL171 TaxID=765915 RepID=A0A1Y2HCP4_9FUNG|nr:P-loop containing nucleoside triphosphate hydrolase protein [Catenaria anguillulae PL171]